MIVYCPNCPMKFDDEYRSTICPHNTFAANDGNNNFRHYPESLLTDKATRFVGIVSSNSAVPLPGPGDWDLPKFSTVTAAGVYQHYKGGKYLLLGIGEHTESKETLAVYVALSGAELPGPRIRCRPWVMWRELVEWPDGSSRPRFVFVGDVG